MPVSPEEASSALGAELLHQLLECGLLREADGRVEAPFHLRTARGLYLFSDYLGTDADAVMGAGETTAVLYGAAQPRQRVGSVLDLGCGAGTLALLLADSADHVVGTDINPRAVALARLNAAVNGVTNAEFRTGDLWEPANGEQFDLIVSQPPYYPSRGGERLTFLHGGERGDEIPRRVMLGLPDRLTPSGRALVFTSWPDGPPPLESMQVLELRAPRDEAAGAHQSIAVVQHGAPWAASFEAGADCWGNVTPEHIDRLRRIQTADLSRAVLRLAPGVRVMREGDQWLAELPPGSLHRLVPMTAEYWQAIQTTAATPELALDALKRGLLIIQSEE